MTDVAASVSVTARLCKTVVAERNALKQSEELAWQMLLPRLKQIYLSLQET